MVSEIFIRYVTTTGLEKTAKFNTDTSTVNMELRNIATVDLLPLIWCKNLEVLDLKNNSLSEVDLTPLEKCPKLKALRLGYNRIQDIDLSSLAACPNVEEVSLEKNRLKIIDLSPLFQCPQLEDLRIDESVTLTADLLLRSIGSWPEVLIERYHRILWKTEPA
jgi:Leucine-rich repeat (LRR) protein